MSVSELLATKLIENEFAAYENLRTLMASPDALSKRGYTIASYALCGFANLSSLGVQIGVLSGLAPTRTRDFVRIAPSAMIAGFISTLQAAGIACVSSQPTSSPRSLSTSADLILGHYFSLSVAACSSELEM
jgi:CNT family concentrative nucleoside transporter